MADLQWRHLSKIHPSMPTASDLDHYGASGWELVQVVKTGAGDWILFFKKPVAIESKEQSDG